MTILYHSPQHTYRLGDRKQVTMNYQPRKARYGHYKFLGEAVRKRHDQVESAVLKKITDQDWFLYRILNMAIAAGSRGFDLGRLYYSLVRPDEMDTDLQDRQRMFDEALAEAESLHNERHSDS